MRSHVDLDLFGILGVTGGEGRTTLGASALVFRQLVWIIDDWQVAVIPPPRTGPILPLAPLRRRSGFPIVILAFKVIRAILGRRFLALATEELILELSVFTAKMFHLCFEVLSPMYGPSVLSFPIANLLPQFGAGGVGEVHAKRLSFSESGLVQKMPFGGNNTDHELALTVQGSQRCTGDDPLKHD
jgi:hypothetical protein